MKNNEVKNGSVVLGMIYPDAIVLAADTKQISISNSTITSAPNILKIHEKGRYFFACTGFLKSFNPDIDIASIINESLVMSKTYINNINRIQENLKSCVYQMAQSLSQNQPQYFTSILNTNFLTVLIATFENETPKCMAIHFEILSSYVGNWEIKINKVEMTTIPSFIPIGEYNAVDSTLNSNPGYWKKFPNIIDALKELIKIQSLSTPTKVGMPCDVVIIKNNSRQWIRNIKD